MDKVQVMRLKYQAHAYEGNIMDVEIKIEDKKALVRRILDTEIPALEADKSKLESQLLDLNVKIEEASKA